MAVLRKDKRSNFTVIDNTVFKDSSLSLKAKGMLCQMLSLPDNWAFTIKGLVKQCKDGKDSVMSALNELEDAGYFRRVQAKSDGKFAGFDYIVSETKIADSPYTEIPNTENPHTEIPNTENPNILNTKEPITNLSNTDSSNTNELYIEFEKLWEIYPRRQGKKKAFEYYKKAKKDGVTFDEVKSGIEAYKAYITAEGRDMEFVKQGSTFFSQRAWEDEYEVNNGRKGNNERSYGTSEDLFGAEPEGWDTIFGA